MFEIERSAPARLRDWDALLDEMGTLAFCRVTLNIVILLASSKRVLFALRLNGNQAEVEEGVDIRAKQ